MGLSDPDVLLLAARAGRILVSHDRKTMPRHFAKVIGDWSSPGLLIVAQDLEIGVAIEELLLIWSATDASEWIDQIGYLPV